MRHDSNPASVQVLSNWELSETPGRFQLDRGSTSMWIKMAMQWVSYALYSWALLAPAVMPDRFQ
jgi:Serine incorporator (Serinc)